MLIDNQTARYLVKVTEAIESGRTDLAQLTDVCPECGVTVNIFSEDHIVVAQRRFVTEAMTSQDAYVVIGCERYWVINPNQVGIESTTWMSWDVDIPAVPTWDEITDDVVRAMNHAEGVTEHRDLG